MGACLCVRSSTRVPSIIIVFPLFLRVVGVPNVGSSDEDEMDDEDDDDDDSSEDELANSPQVFLRAYFRSSPWGDGTVHVHIIPLLSRNKILLFSPG